eukprot:g6509.t1
MVDTRFDDLFLNLAAQHNGIEGLLQTFFSFLHRKTDFYVVANKNNGKMGFPAGVAERILLRSFHSLPMKDIDAVSRGMEKAQARESKEADRKAATAKAARAKAKAKKEAKAKAEKSGSSGGSTASSGAALPRALAPGKDGAFDVSGAGDSLTAAVASAPTSPAASSASAPAATATAGAAAADAPLPPQQQEQQLHPDAAVRIRYTDEGKQVPIGNGGVTANYWWTQTLYETTVYVDVPAGTRARDLDVDIKPRRLCVALKGGSEAGNGRYIDGALPERVRCDECYWNLESNRQVVVVLQKVVETWWRSVVEGDAEIDCTKVDSTMKIDEYDDETQGAIRKIMFDQKQKALGLPTSDQLQADEILERAKSLPGSPFLPPGAAE